MKFLFALFFILMALAGYQVSADYKKCPKGGQVVCGKNGKTYANACLAKQAGTTVAHNGKCGYKGGYRRV